MDRSEITGELKKPDWIRFRIPGGEKYARVKKAVKAGFLHTVCTEALCPNIGECFSSGTATFLILGDICTRDCRYCSIKKGKPADADFEEPHRIAKAVSELDLRHSVITSVTRDDIPDGGASIFADTVNQIRSISSQCSVELLVPDFGPAMNESVQIIIDSSPDVINHNIEVTENFFGDLRPLGNYVKSLELIKKVSMSEIKTKSGLMIGFGESMKDIERTVSDLYYSGCEILTVGQYLKSSRNGFSVKKYYTHEEFNEIRTIAESIGIKKVLSSPLARSSYHAADFA